MNQPTLDPAQFWFKSRDTKLELHETAWGSYLERFALMARAGAPLSDYVAYFDRAATGYRGFIDPAHLEDLSNLDLGAFAGKPPPQRLGVAQGKYVTLGEGRLGSDILLGAIDHILTPDVDCVVEFGSGLGTNLARLRLRHPGRDLTYIACEPTAAGRSAAMAMYAADLSMTARALPFDYFTPDLAFLADFRRPVAFTNHSIEQVALCGPFYEALLASNVAACVHVEPAGWQRFTNIFDVVLSMYRSQATFSTVLRQYRWVIEDARLPDNSAMWAAHYLYNIDLLHAVSAAAERGQIALFALAYDVIGHNPFNPSTVIGWVRKR